MAMGIPDIDELDAELRQRVRWGEAVYVAGMPGDLESWDILLLDEDGVVIASQEFSFIGTFHPDGLDAVRPILNSAGLAYEDWTRTDKGYEAVLRKVAPWS
jgi:hypothetical protein